MSKPKKSNEKSNLINPILSVSPEYDAVKNFFFSDIPQDRSNWLQEALDLNPEISEFRDQVDPLARAVKFGKLYLPPDRLVEQQALLSLILQHLRTLGLTRTQSSLHTEWGVPFDVPAHLSSSQLTLIIQRGIGHVEKFWELSKGLPTQKEQEKKYNLDQAISTVIGGVPTILDSSHPIESEEFMDPQYIKYDIQKNIISEASFNQLIYILTSDTQMLIPELLSAFCFTYKAFVTSEAFFSKIRERFRMSVKQDDKMAMERSCNLLKQWYDMSKNEIEQPIIAAMKNFIEKEVKPRAPHISIDFDQVQSTANISLSEVDYSKAHAVNIGNCTALWTGNFSLFDLPPDEVARQVTYRSSLKFYAIQRSELFDGAWENPRLMHRSPNVVAMRSQMNTLSNWVSSSIFNSATSDEKNQRISYFIQVARSLWEMQNYYDIFTFIGALNDPEIQMSKKDSAFVKEVATKLDSSNNQKAIRELNAHALTTKKPTLPCITNFLSDLARLSQSGIGGKGNLLRLDMCMQLYEIIQTMEKYKEPKYCILPIIQVQDKLDQLLLGNQS